MVQVPRFGVNDPSTVLEAVARASAILQPRSALLFVCGALAPSNAAAWVEDDKPTIALKRKKKVFPKKLTPKVRTFCALSSQRLRPLDPPPGTLESYA